MKTLILSICLALTACAHNLAVEMVTDLEPLARCKPYYTDVGPLHVHSTKCTMPDHTERYFVISADKGPASQTLASPAAPDRAEYQQPQHQFAPTPAVSDPKNEPHLPIPSTSEPAKK